MNGLGVLSYEAFPPSAAALDANARALVAAVWQATTRTLTSGAPTQQQIADAILGRSLAGGADGGRTVRDALRTMRNRVTVDKDTGVVTIYAEDDSTVAWTAAATFVKRDAVASVDPG